MTGAFWSTWASDDVEFIRTQFPQGISFRVSVLIGGSTTQGQPDHNLVNTEFKIKFLEPTSVNACANNVLYPVYATKAGVQSDDRVLDFTIGASSGSI
jgi:hypothetical protein